MALVFSFPLDHSLWELKNGTSKLVKSKIAKSSFFDSFEGAVNVPDDFDKRYSKTVHASIYEQILFDKYRSVYYRFVKLASPYAVHPKTNLKLDVYSNKPFSIIILDKELNKIGETLFPADTYYPFMGNAFVAPEGLFISNANSFSENPEKEGERTFIVLNLVANAQ